jgi:thiamine kinase-like enzyme
MLKSRIRIPWADPAGLRRLGRDWKRALRVEGLGFRPTARRSERRLIRRLRRLGLWCEDLTVDQIPGGMTNRNYAIRGVSGRPADSYIARLCEPRPLLGIDRRNEWVCQEAAGAWGLAPEVVYHEDGLLISRFIEGRTLTADDLREPATLDRLAALLRRLHGSWDAMAGEVLYFCPFQVIRTYARTASRLGAELPDDLDAMLEDAGRLSQRIAPFRPVLCHNDLIPANLIDDGQRLWLVDWEYAGVGNPLFDLANVSANAELGADHEAALLAAYRETAEADPRDLAELRVFKAASLLREALWGAIQSVASDLDVDYRRYASDNLAAYRSAVESA